MPYKQKITRKFFKYISIEIEYTDEKANIICKFFNKIKIRHKLFNPLLNKFFCKLTNIKTLLIVRFDGIGDFLLTRPFFKNIKESAKFKDYKIIFMGKPDFVDLAKKYDYEYIDSFIGLNIDIPLDRKILKKLAKKSYADYLINPCDHKCNKHLENFVATIKAKNKICHKGFFSYYDIKSNNKLRTINCLKKYNRIIDTGENVRFVLDKNKLFFEKIINEKIQEVPDLIDLNNIVNDIVSVNFDYILISPFSRSEIRTYSPENFGKIINYIIQNLNIPVIIMGSIFENKSAEYIRNLCINPQMVYNMAGQLTINESALLIKNAKLLIANETGTVHIAKNFRTTTICISNGSYMNTFQPYPEKYMNYIYPDNIEQILTNNDDAGTLIDYDINKIDPNKVINKIKEIML